MANVKSVEGIFRKLGKEEAVEFLAGYVLARVRDLADKPIQRIVNLLETTSTKRWSDRTFADAAIESFNSMY